MIITQTNPSQGIESASLEFPNGNTYDTGKYTFTVKAETFLETRVITNVCYKVPVFAVSIELSVPTGELNIRIGPAEDIIPNSQTVLLPRYIKDTSEHVFEISFINWQVVNVKMNGTALQTAPVPTDIILIHHGIEEIASAHDLLRPTGTIPLEISGNLDSLNGSSLFLLKSQSYEFHLYIEKGEIVFKRSGYSIRGCPDDGQNFMAWIAWSPTQLQLFLPNNRTRTSWSITTPIATPSKSLFHLARVKKLQPTISFASALEFRTAVHEALCSLQDDIKESGAYNGFWDQSYQGRRKVDPKPKKETDIHQQILLPLYDWAKMRSVEVVPENETAVGKLDICFIGIVEGQGPVSFCVEVKLAHSPDLEHGLDTQLPAYIAAKHAEYGAYVILWFKNGWFGLPGDESIHNLRQRIVPGTYDPFPSSLSELEFALTSKIAIQPNLRNIRVFILDVTKPNSASKK